MTREDLEAQGWLRQTTYDEPRLGELVDMYEELGYEVRLEPFEPDDEPECSECMKLQRDLYKTIYIRKRPPRTDTEEQGS